MGIEEKLSKSALSFLGSRSEKPSQKQIDEHVRLLAERDLIERSRVEATRDAARQQETGRLQKMADDLRAANAEYDECTTDIATLRAKLEKLRNDMLETEKQLTAANNGQRRSSIRQRVLQKFERENAVNLLDQDSWEPMLSAAADKAMS